MTKGPPVEERGRKPELADTPLKTRKAPFAGKAILFLALIVCLTFTGCKPRNALLDKTGIATATQVTYRETGLPTQYPKLRDVLRVLASSEPVDVRPFDYYSGYQGELVFTVAPKDGSVSIRSKVFGDTAYLCFLETQITTTPHMGATLLGTTTPRYFSLPFSRFASVVRLDGSSSTTAIPPEAGKTADEERARPRADLAILLRGLFPQLEGYHLFPSWANAGESNAPYTDRLASFVDDQLRTYGPSDDRESVLFANVGVNRVAVGILKREKAFLITGKKMLDTALGETWNVESRGEANVPSLPVEKGTRRIGELRAVPAPNLPLGMDSKLRGGPNDGVELPERLPSPGYILLPRSNGDFYLVVYGWNSAGLGLRVSEVHYLPDDSIAVFCNASDAVLSPRASLLVSGNARVARVVIGDIDVPEIKLPNR